MRYEKEFSAMTVSEMKKYTLVVIVVIVVVLFLLKLDFMNILLVMRLLKINGQKMSGIVSDTQL